MAEACRGRQTGVEPLRFWLHPLLPLAPLVQHKDAESQDLARPNQVIATSSWSRPHFHCPPARARSFLFVRALLPAHDMSGQHCLVRRPPSVGTTQRTLVVVTPGVPSGLILCRRSQSLAFARFSRSHENICTMNVCPATVATVLICREAFQGPRLGASSARVSRRQVLR